MALLTKDNWGSRFFFLPAWLCYYSPRFNVSLVCLSMELSFWQAGGSAEWKHRKECLPFPAPPPPTRLNTTTPASPFGSQHVISIRFGKLPSTEHSVTHNHIHTLLTTRTGDLCIYEVSYKSFIIKTSGCLSWTWMGCLFGLWFCWLQLFFLKQYLWPAVIEPKQMEDLRQDRGHRTLKPRLLHKEPLTCWVKVQWSSTRQNHRTMSWRISCRERTHCLLLFIRESEPPLQNDGKRQTI